VRSPAIGWKPSGCWQTPVVTVPRRCFTLPRRMQRLETPVRR